MPSAERSEADTDSAGLFFFLCVCVVFFLSVADYELNDSEIMISRSSG